MNENVRGLVEEWKRRVEAMDAMPDNPYKEVRAAVIDACAQELQIALAQPAGEAVAWQQRQRPDTNPVGALAHWCAISQQTYEECKDDPAFHLYEFRPLYAHPQFTRPTPADSAPLVEGVPESEWRWHGMAAHFICAADCLFHMATEVGGYMISTVGDLRLHKPGEGRGERQEIGCGRMYETFVFATKDTRCNCGCGMPEINLSELDTEAANDPETARINHMAMCAKYAALAAEPPHDD